MEYSRVNFPPNFYVYAYLRSSDLTPYYIGKGVKDRAWNKNHNVSRPRKLELIVVCEANLTEIGALALERRLIRWYGRIDNGTGILHNRTDGGEGVTGYVYTHDDRRKMSEANIKRVKRGEHIFIDSGRQSEFGKLGANVSNRLQIEAKTHPLLGKNSRRVFGAEHPKSLSLSFVDIENIQQDLMAGMLQKTVAIKYGISQTVVSQIKRKSYWKIKEKEAEASFN